MYLKLFLLLFPGNARTLQCFSLSYARINFYAICHLMYKRYLYLSPTTTINVVLNSVHSDSPSHAPISSWRAVLTSGSFPSWSTPFSISPNRSLLVGLRLRRRLSPAFISRGCFLWVCCPGGSDALCMPGASLGCGCVAVSLGGFAWPPCYTLGGVLLFLLWLPEKWSLAKFVKLY